MKHTLFIHAILAFACCAAVSSPAKTHILALAPGSAQFQTVLAGIRAELDTSYVIETVDVSKPVEYEQLVRYCSKNDVKALVLMDRKAVLTAYHMQKLDSSIGALPKFVYMTLMAEITNKLLSNVAGIKFEVPIYTLVTNFRIISQKEFSRVGIFFSKSCAGSVEDAEKLLGKERISLQTMCIDCGQQKKTNAQEALKIMKKSFDKMVNEQGSEVFLVLTDNNVVNSASLSGFWLEKVKKRGIPVIASLDILASPLIALAVFTADPDLPELGAQAANQIAGFFETKIPLETIGFEPTISVKYTLNLTVAKTLGWKLKEGKLGRIKNIVE